MKRATMWPFKKNILKEDEWDIPNSPLILAHAEVLAKRAKLLDMSKADAVTYIRDRIYDDHGIPNISEAHAIEIVIRVYTA